ncbi:MAG: transporter substrate-binding domain-containing protein [Myxococcota bacterium]
MARPPVPLALLILLACPRADGQEGAQARADAGVLTPRVEEQSLAPQLGDLAMIRARGSLRILVYGRAPSLLPRSGNPVLQDESMARAFARKLELEPVVVEVDAQDALISALNEGRGDLIAAQLTVTETRAEQVVFARAGQAVREMLVGPTDLKKPIEGLDDLKPGEVHVRASSSYAESLKAQAVPFVAADESQTTPDLLEAVARGRIPFTVADEHILEAVQGYRPGLQAILPVAEGRQLAWALRKDTPELQAAVNRFVLERALTHHARASYREDLPAIQERGVLRVLTRNNPISYFLHRGRPFGFDHRLAQMLADDLDLRLQMVIAPSRDDLIPWLLEGRADLVAATLTATPERRAKVRFSEPYLFTRELVVGQRGAKLPRNLEELADRTLHVRASSSYFETLQALQSQGANFEIAEVNEEMETEAIADAVAAGRFDLTVMDRHLLQVEAAFGTAVVEAFPLPVLLEVQEYEEGKELPIAFASRPADEALGRALDGFVERVYRGLNYNIAKKRYFEDQRRFAKAKKARTGKTGTLSPYDELIKKYARRYELDWRLMAAQAYVESGFDPKAKSWVGALGLFQVMPRTGRSLGFTRLERPDEGIHAGVKYMDRLIGRFDPEVPLEERVRLAMAAYNAGLGHVYDAQRLAAELGKDPNVWFGNVEEAMLLLAQPEYARRARHGYCRGGQPVAYVRHIQELYEAYAELTED